MGKGEVADAIEKYNEVVKTNEHLMEKAMYDQALATYAIQLAAAKGKVPEAIVGVEDWNKSNEDLKAAEDAIKLMSNGLKAESKIIKEMEK